MEHGIATPFAKIPRAKLERMVREGFEAIELHDYGERMAKFGHPPALYSAHDFQVLMAAAHYLATTKEAA